MRAREGRQSKRCKKRGTRAGGARAQKRGRAQKIPPRSRGGKRRGVSRGAVRKRRREKGDFAVSRRQSALTTTKGAGAAKPRRPRWGLRPAGRSTKRSGRTLVAPAALRRFSLRSHQNRPFPGAEQSGSAKRPRPRRGLGPAGRSAKQSGRIFVAPAARAPGFWMKKARRAAPQALVAWGPLCVFYAPKSSGKTAVFLCHPGFQPFFLKMMSLEKT